MRVKVPETGSYLPVLTTKRITTMSPYADYYKSQLAKVQPHATQYPPTFKVFANGNGENTNHISLNDVSAKALIDWLRENYPNCEDKKQD